MSRDATGSRLDKGEWQYCVRYPLWRRQTLFQRLFPQKPGMWREGRIRGEENQLVEKTYNRLLCPNNGWNSGRSDRCGLHQGSIPMQPTRVARVIQSQPGGDRHKMVAGIF